jgi:16S rRNA processing protein RimM
MSSPATRRNTLSRTAGEGGSPARASRARVPAERAAIAPSPQPSPPMGEREIRRVCVGVVTGAHGVRGAVRVKSFTAEPEDVAVYGPVEDERGDRRFTLRLVGNAKGVLIAQIAGIEDRNAAEALRGLRLYLPREALPPPGEEEYYHADLIGLAAALADGTPVGTVRAVHDFGAGDTLEIDRAAGQPVMVPFTRAVVPVVDIEGGRLVLDPPEGLLDPPKREKERA